MSLPFHLLFEKVRTIYAKDVHPWQDMGLSPGQPKILYYLEEEKGCIQRDLADWCTIEPATVSKLLDNMESKGLILRKSQLGDKRSLYVYLTPKGKEAQSQIGKRFAEIEAQALTGFSEEEQKAFRSFLKRMAYNLDPEMIQSPVRDQD